VEQLGHHATRGQVWEKAVDYLRQAGAKAFAASANRESVTCFEQALEALAHLPATPETAEQGIDLRFDLRNALFVLGQYERVDERIREADGLARTLNDSRRLGWVSVYMSLNRFLKDDPIQQRVSAEHALAIAEMLADGRLQVAANCLLGAAHLDSGEYRRADAVFRTVVASLDDKLTRDHCGLHMFPAVFSRVYGARALAECGAFEQGIGYGKDALRLAESLGHSFSLIQAFRHVGYLYRLKGEFDRAVDLLERGLALARQGERIPAREIQLMEPLGNVYARLGRVTEGLTLLVQASQTREAMGTEGRGQYYSLFLVDLGHAYVLANRLEDARASAGRALTVARERGGRGDEAHALHLLGEITAQGDPLDAETADGYYRQALARATELEMRPLVAHCHLGLGTLYRGTGDRAKAEEHLTTAVTMYREMGMTFWLEKAEAELRGVGR
jgi:tetratricopeptide (TPR) repeat protein